MSPLKADTWYQRWKHRMSQRFTLSRLDRPRFRRCLDLGRGLGDWTEMFARRADEVLACELADRMPSGIDLAYVGAGLLDLRDQDVLDVLYRLRQASVTNALVIVRQDCTFNFGRSAQPDARAVDRTAGQVVELAESAGLRCLEVRSSPSMYAEMMGNAITRWPLRMGWRLLTLHWTRATHTFVFRA